MTPEEKGVAARIRAHRRTVNLNQAELSKRAGITRDQLARIELGRARLRLGAALAIANALRISLAWIAEGYGPALFHISPGPEILQKLSEKRPFLEEYKRGLRSLFHEKIKQNTPERWLTRVLARVEQYELTSQSAGISTEATVQQVPNVLGAYLNSCPPYLRTIFIANLNVMMRDFLRDHDAEFRAFNEMRRHDANKSLTSVDASVIDESVKALWPVLKMRLRKATSGKGERTALAKYLRVNVASLAQWLRDSENAREPGAETALRMLKWVELQERK